SGRIGLGLVLRHPMARAPGGAAGTLTQPHRTFKRRRYPPPNDRRENAVWRSSRASPVRNYGCLRSIESSSLRGTSISSNQPPATTMALDAVLFDLVGPLANENSLHARAWHRAMKEHGYAVGVDRIAIEIGKGGSMLVPAVLGREAEQKHGDSLREAHDAHFL